MTAGGKGKQCLKAVKKFTAIKHNLLDSDDVYSTSLLLEDLF